MLKLVSTTKTCYINCLDIGFGLEHLKICKTDEFYVVIPCGLLYCVVCSEEMVWSETKRHLRRKKTLSVEEFF